MNDRQIGIKIHMERNYATGGYDLYIVQNRHDGRYIAKPMNLEFDKFDPAKTVDPSLRLFDIDSEEFMRAMAEAMDERGIKTDKDATIQGKLDAQDAHLEDMRRLVFKDKYDPR